MPPSLRVKWARYMEISDKMTIWGQLCQIVFGNIFIVTLNEIWNSCNERSFIFLILKYDKRFHTFPVAQFAGTRAIERNGLSEIGATSRDCAATITVFSFEICS